MSETMDTQEQPAVHPQANSSADLSVTPPAAQTPAEAKESDNVVKSASELRKEALAESRNTLTGKKTETPAKAEVPEPAKKEVTPAPVVEETIVEPVIEPEPELEETQTDEEKTAAEEAAAKAKEQDEDGELPKRPKITGWKDVERMAVQIKLRNPSLSLGQAESKAALALGLPDPNAPKETQSEPEAIPSQESFDTKIADLKKQKDEAKTAYDVDKVDELSEQISKIRLESVEAKQKRESQSKDKEQAVRAEQARHATELGKSQDAVLTDYSHLDVKNEESAFRKAMTEEAAKYGDNDPIARSPEFAEFIAAKVAKRPEFSKIKPKAEVSQPLKPVVSPKKPVVSPAPAITPVVTPTPKAETPAELRARMSKMTVKERAAEIAA